MRLGQGVRDIAFLLLKLHQVRLQDLSKLAAARHRQSWVVKTWQKPRWVKAGKEEKLNKTTMPHISVFKKPRETCQMGSCSHGMFFATIPYRFRYRFVIVSLSFWSHETQQVGPIPWSCQRLFSIAGIAFGGAIAT